MSRDRVIIFDTTLRDGEQSAGVSMNTDEKLLIAKALAGLGVDVMEAGFAIASEGDFKAIEAISQSVKGSVICSLARAVKKDIDYAAQALKAAERKRIHTFISTSPLHMKYKLQMDEKTVLEKIKESVSYARSYTDDVEWSAEDGSRTQIDFLCRVVETAIKAGATTVNIPDTVGYTTPDEFKQMIATLFHRVPNIDQAVVSVHCHNDLGLAVANSLVGLDEGVRQIECTINGLGERAGNGALEEIVMALKTRSDLMPYETGIDTTKITQVSRLVSRISGFLIQPNKAIVGRNAFAHESGIHQDGFLKHAQTYEIMTPESVGLVKSSLFMGKHSGRHALKQRLKDLGIENLSNEMLDDVFHRFKKLTDKKKEIFDDDLLALMEGQMCKEDRIKFIQLSIECGSAYPSKASLTLDIDGQEKNIQASGHGPVDAVFHAIKKLTDYTPKLLLYQVHAVTQGTDAQARVSVRLEDENGYHVLGAAADTDTIVASCCAYINAVNKLWNQ